MKSRTLLTICIIGFIYVVLQFIPIDNIKYDNSFMVEEGEAPLVIAHGGGKVLNPENTWMALDYAYELGVDVLEVDLHLTKDNVLVTYHNNTLDDLSTASGKVADYTYDELKEHNFGQFFVDLDGNMPYKNLSQEELASYDYALSLASLEEMFIKYGKDVLYVVEIKDDGDLGIKAADELMRLITKYEMEEYACMASFHPEVIAYINDNKTTNMINSYDFDTSLMFVIASLVGFDYFMDSPSHGFQLPTSEYSIPLTSPYLLSKIERHDKFIHYWTVNEIDEMMLCIEANADGIITDRPDLLIPLLEELGY